MNVLAQVLPVAGPWAIFGAICLWLMRSGFRDRQKYIVRERARQAAEAEKNKQIEDALKRAAEAPPQLELPYAAPYASAVGRR